MSAVRAPYSGLIVVNGWPRRADGLPNTVTAAMWLVIAAGIGALNPTPAIGDVAMTSTTAAPCEYPPTTILVLGHFAAVAWMRALASLAPSTTPRKSQDAGYWTA